MDQARDQIVGNTLDRVVFRVDYSDIIEIGEKNLKKIQEICLKYDLEIGHKKLDVQSDFAFNDVLPFNRIPENFLENAKNYIFKNPKDDKISVEVNPFFFRIKHVVGNDYKYSGSKYLLEILKKILTVLLTNNSLSIKRIGVRKVNQVFFKEINSFEKYYKKEIINLNQFDGAIKWNIDYTESSLMNNFRYNDIWINFITRFDSGLVEDNKYYRLYLDYEGYSREKELINNMIFQQFDVINDSILDLFLKSLTDEGIALLETKERLGDL